MISLIRPILISWVTSRAVKELVCDLLDRLAASTENELDDAAVRGVRAALLGE